MFHNYAERASLPKKNRAGWYYHPFEFAISGFTGSGKTTLISALIKKLNEENIHPSYVKNDAHKFQMDKEGKDTYEAYHSGAQSVSIRDRNHSALIMDGNFDQAVMEQNILRSDCLLIEGNKHSDIPKVFLLDPKEEGLELLKDGHDDTNILAVVGPAELLAKVPNSYRTIDRNDTDAVFQLIMDHFQANQPPLYGLVLIGGKSKRMGKDKANLDYQGKNQTTVALELLKNCCERLFLSTRPGQVLDEEVKKALNGEDVELLEDRFLDFGPQGGILSAQVQHPEAAWLVIGVDLPLLQKEDVLELLNFRNPFKFATCFGTDKNKKGDKIDYLLPEPLCAVYEPKSYSRILALLGRGVDCPRGFLKESPIEMKKPSRESALFNANSPEDRIKAISLIEDGIKKQ